MPNLGRKFAPDARDKNFPLSASIPATISRPIRKQWAIWWKGDQGSTSQCVGYSWHGLLRARPLTQYDPKPDFIYHEAQKVDEWPGEEPTYEGTSVRAGAKVLLSEGKIKEYRWAFNVDTVLNWLGNKGPVVMGTIWTVNMFNHQQGVVRIGDPTDIAGGHCYLAIGYNDQSKLITFQNSWGRSWGDNGRFYISYDEVDYLIKQDGEACTPTEV
jgi:hypothetical protein